MGLQRVEGDTMKRLVPLAVAFATAFGLSAPPVFAGWLSAYSGHTKFSSGNLTVWVSAAVYENPSDLPEGAFKTDLSSAGADLNAAYLYLYQVVSTGDLGMKYLEVPVFSEAAVTSYGAVPGWVFDEANVIVHYDTGNYSLGTGVGDFEYGVENFTVSTSANLGTPIVSLETPDMVINWTFSPKLPGGNPIIRTSCLLFFTSNTPPGFRLARVQDTDTAVLARVPTVPEPGVLLGLATMAPFGLAILRRRLRTKKQ